ncbi:SDR family oxidoreductase [Granulicoccus phenolivorans]|uniref:SDR family oxidoreductase n=1 Tax=Granulicoccus phenolivorans TaxID=266854 RepID=UPI0003FCEA74|nr:SDR family oxidoreductase [Granulicoccus phenolivorans]
MTDNAQTPVSNETTGKLRAVVTGASTGIGDATVRRLLAEGWSVLAVARREDRLAKLAAETGCDYVAADITSDEDVARIVEAAGPTHALVNNAGGARGVDRVDAADLDNYRWMYETNVLGTVRLTKAMLPQMIPTGRADVLLLTSVAAHGAYEGGGGYTAAKNAERIIGETLRLELNGQPVRVIEIAPGMVQTEEFSLRRLGNDQAKADAVYEGVPNPLVAEDIADAIVWTLTRPHHVNIDLMVIKPLAQAAFHKVYKEA